MYKCFLQEDEMKKATIMAFILLMGIFFTVTASAQELPVVTVVNNTGYTVFHVYISRVAANNWEEDVLGNDILRNNSSVNVRLTQPLDVTNRYDIKVVDLDGDSYTKQNVLITPNARIIFTLSDID